MEWIQILQAFLSLVFVIGLLLLTVWVFKLCEQKGLKSQLVKNLKGNNRIQIIETRRIDTKNSICLIECDSQQYLVLCGATQNLLLNNQPLSQGQSSND